MSALQKNGKPFDYIASELLDDKREATGENVFAKCGRSPIMIGDITKYSTLAPLELDLLFVDTDHDAEVTQFIVDNIWPRLKKGGLLALHDFAVEEKDGIWVGKGHDGIGGLPETQLYTDMFHNKKWPFKKLYWCTHNLFRNEIGLEWKEPFFEKPNKKIFFLFYRGHIPPPNPPLY